MPRATATADKSLSPRTSDISIGAGVGQLLINNAGGTAASATGNGGLVNLTTSGSISY